MARWHSKPKSGEDTEMDPNKAWRRTGPRRRPRRKEAPATAEEAAARPPSDSERSVLAPLLSSSRGRVRRYYVALKILIKLLLSTFLVTWHT